MVADHVKLTHAQSIARKVQQTSCSPVPPREVLDISIDSGESNVDEVAEGIKKLHEHFQARKREMKLAAKEMKARDKKDKSKD